MNYFFIEGKTRNFLYIIKKTLGSYLQHGICIITGNFYLCCKKICGGYLLQEAFIIIRIILLSGVTKETCGGVTYYVEFLSLTQNLYRSTCKINGSSSNFENENP